MLLCTFFAKNAYVRAKIDDTLSRKIREDEESRSFLTVSRHLSLNFDESAERGTHRPSARQGPSYEERSAIAIVWRSV